MKHKITLTICIAMLLVTACKKKDKEEEETEKEKLTKVLTGGLWYHRLVFTDYTEPGRDDKYVVPFPDDCEKDNYYKYNSDGKYLYSVGKDTCGGAEGNYLYDPYRWKVADDGKSITISEYNDKGTILYGEKVYMIKSYSTELLVLYKEYEDRNYKVTEHYHFKNKP